MKIVSVSGGKGGTGKSFVATNLAVALSREKHVTLADLDVEGPSDHLLLGVELKEEEPILEGQRVIGYTYHTAINESFELVSGVMREGEEHTPPAVKEAKKRALRYVKDIMLVDTGAGTGSHISMAIKDSKLLVAVTEPTPLGLHDLELILEVAKKQRIPTWVVINKYGIGESSLMADKITTLAMKYGLMAVARVPYDEEVIRSLVSKKPIAILNPDHRISTFFYHLAEMILEVI